MTKEQRTLRSELLKAGFDVHTGVIVLEDTVIDSGNDGYAYNPSFVWEAEQTTNRRQVSIWSDDCAKVLGEYDSLPRFVAQDEGYTYFPGKYDGSTWVARVRRDVLEYLSDGREVLLPYIGGN